ncbi:MAG: CpsD/CapB family tyrosine-protein kinase [Oscillospiraceae bacterium]|nr:CpsD/CapB family tyrosine-protein kinase [Oscillospiraceae bacterium]
MQNEVITFRSPKSRISEAFKELRTNLEFSMINKQVKTILVTSALPGEGKSWTSSNLAVAFAQHKKKVILVDADLRRGTQADIFNVQASSGLSNLLSDIDQNEEDFDKIDFDKYIMKTEIDNLSIIPSGIRPINPSELLASNAMKLLIDILKFNYDYIIFDGTPSILVTDSIILSSLLDTTVIVAKYKTTKIDSLKQLKKSIGNVGGKIAGVVLNKIPNKRQEYSYGYTGYYE